MTPEERTTKIRKATVGHNQCDCDEEICGYHLTLAEIRAAVAETKEACHVESRPDGYWLVLKNKSGGAAINLDGPSRGPIVRTVLMVAALGTGKEVGG